MMPVMGKRTMIGGATVAVLLAMAVHDARWGPPACNSEAWAFPIKPKMIFGLSIGFGPWAKAAFPVGSCEADLVAWMDRVGFGDKRQRAGDSHVIDTEEKERRAYARRASGELIYLRTFSQKAVIGSSYFSIAWNRDYEGRISEVFANSELMHFYLP